MKLLNLSVKNFKCLQSFELNANGQNISIYAENGIGKTTIADAYYWLVFGKDSLGRKDFEIKPVGPDGEPVHFLDVSVRGTFAMDGGSQITLERTYRETWETKRGSSTKTFTGHTTDYAFNGVPVQAGEYSKRIAAICDEERFRLLSDPARFMALAWQERRKMLFDVCGDMNDAEVIATVPELEELGKLIGSYSIADFRKVTDSQKQAAAKEREQIPARIDEANRALPIEDVRDWKAELAKRSEALTAAQNERSSLQAGGKKAEINARITTIQADIRAIESHILNAPNPERQAALDARSKKADDMRNADQAALDIQPKLGSAKRSLESLDGDLARKRTEANAEKAKTYTGASECPTCKRALPEDEVQKAVEEFNSAKAIRLDAMVQAGKKLVADREELAQNVESLEAQLKDANAKHAALKAEYDAILIPEQTQADPKADHKHIELTAELAKAQAELSKLDSDMAASVGAINAKIVDAQEAANEANRAIAAQSQRAEGLKRIDELKAREKDLSGILEGCERAIYLCEQFVRAKVRMLTERINGRFLRTTFRLFREQINGGLTESCDVLWRENEALPSNGQAVQIGLDIISTLSEHAGFAPCIFVDNAESVTDLPQTQGQQIRLIVSKGDKELRIEADGEAMPKAEKQEALF